MNNWLSFLLIILFPVTIWAQEMMVQGRVVDAETGEIMPYALIYMSNGRGTMSNFEGEFCLSVSQQDVLTFSYVGYEKLSVKAVELPPIIKLKSFEKMLGEVVVEPIEEMNILKQVIRHLKQDYSKHKKEKQGYFLRVLLKNKEDSYLIESLMAGYSAVNLREAETLSGTNGLNVEGDESNMGLRLTNIHKLAEIGASTYQSVYWREVIKPLTSMTMIRKYYRVHVETLYSSDGEKLYRFIFHWNDRYTKSLGRRRYLTGTLYVDAKSRRLLRFDGEVNNAYQWVNNQRTPSSIKFHVNYAYTYGYAAVNNIAFEGGNEEMKYQGLLFCIQDDSFFTTSSGFSETNILHAVDEAGYNPVLWERYNIVKRTKEEERAAFGDKE